MSRSDLKYENPELLTRVLYDIQNIVKVNKFMGSKRSNAYYIHSYGEETYLLEQYGGVVQNKETYKEHSYKHFNIYTLKMPDGKLRKVYMNVTVPIVNTKILQAVADLEK